MTQRRPLSTGPDPSFARQSSLSRAGRAAVLAVLLLAAASAVAAAVHRIAQRGRAFSMAEITIPQGDTLQFTNDDEFLHQIYVDSSRMYFDSDEQPPGQTIDVTFPARGTFPVRCHIHPKMLLTVHVQ